LSGRGKKGRMKGGETKREATVEGFELLKSISPEDILAPTGAAPGGRGKGPGKYVHVTTPKGARDRGEDRVAENVEHGGSTAKRGGKEPGKGMF